MATKEISTTPVPVSSYVIADMEQKSVNARELHHFLGIDARFNDWIIRRVEEYRFIQNKDFVLVTQKRVTKGRGGNRKETVEYFLTLDMAKELAMVERTDKGREARQYFIDCERQAKASSETISATQQHELQVIVAQRAGTADDYGKRRMYIWSRFNNHFKLAGYKQLPTSRFGEAVDYLLAMPTKWQLPAQNLPALLDQTTNHLWLVLNGSGQVVESVTLTDAAVLRGQVDKHFSAQALLDRGAVIGDMDSLTDIMHEAMAKMRNTLNPLVTVLGTATNATQADADAFWGSRRDSAAKRLSASLG